MAIAARAEPTARTTVGIDVEIPRAFRTDVTARVLTPDERAAVAAMDTSARDGEILFRFAAKEAIYKALDPWVQRLVSFQEAEIVRDAGGRRAVRLALARGEGPFTVALHDVGGDGLVMVVATVTPQKK